MLIRSRVSTFGQELLLEHVAEAKLDQVQDKPTEDQAANMRWEL